MEVKVSTFNQEIIRTYMESSSALEKGIAYYKHVNPTISDDQAKELAIREAQDRSYSIWANDSTGYISNERMAFSEFIEYVDKGRYFSIDRYLSAQSFNHSVERTTSFLKKVFLGWCIFALSVGAIIGTLILTGVIK